MSDNVLDTGLYAGAGTFKEDGTDGGYVFFGAGLSEDEWAIFHSEAREPNITDGDTSDYLRGVNRTRAKARAGDRAKARARVRDSAIAYTRAPAGPFRSRITASDTPDSADWTKNIDRPPNATVNGGFAGALVYDGADKVGAYACAGVGRTRLECSIVDVEAKVANAGVGVEVSEKSVSAFVKAELVGVSASAGPVKVQAALSADTGVRVGPESLEAEVLGTGVKLGRTVGFKLFGSGIEFNLW